MARFDYPRSQLVEDLTGVVFFVGVHPFTPDSMIEVDISDDEVQIRYADWFLASTPPHAQRRSAVADRWAFLAQRSIWNG